MPLTPIQDALEQLIQSVKTCDEAAESIPLTNVSGRILASDIVASLDVPNCANSAMDGYAVKAADIQNTPTNLRVTQRIPAGQVGSTLNSGEAARIFTGAPLPEGADAVVMQENTEASGDDVVIKQAAAAGENLRAAGEDIKAGATLYKAGHRLRPQDAGVLASVGCTSVAVHRPLKVAVFTTGDELVTPGKELGPGQIYNSNFYSLSALLQRLHAEVIDLGVIEDDFESTKTALTQAAEVADCIITTGGVSVGEEDHVKAAVESTGNLDLWKLAIKPGKPFASGKVLGKQFFGLPGNPVSSFVTFSLLVRPLLMRMQGCVDVFAKPLPLRAGFSAAESGERQEYIRVTLESTGAGGARIVPYETQSSGAGASLSAADGLAIIPPYTAVNEGDTLMYLPFSELLS